MQQTTGHCHHQIHRWPHQSSCHSFHTTLSSAVWVVVVALNLTSLSLGLCRRTTTATASTGRTRTCQLRFIVPAHIKGIKFTSEAGLRSNSTGVPYLQCTWKGVGQSS